VHLSLTIALAALAAWLFWRIRKLERGIGALGKTLKQGDVSGTGGSLSEPLPAPILPLATVVFDSVSEAGLERDSATRQRLFLEALLNEIKDSIFILDQNGEIRFVNESGRRLFPSDQPYLHRPFLEVCRDHRIEETLDLALEIGAKVSDQVALKAPGNEPGRFRELKLLVEAEPLAFANDALGASGAWVLLRDVTSELETEQIRRDFLANASHELRTPLSILNGYLETMDEIGIDLNDEVYRRAIRTMRKHGGRIARIVEDMLTISKLENASDLLNVEPFDLRESLDEILAQLLPLIEQNHARITTKVDAQESWILEGDRYYWDQIFFNLIENALKQNPEPGLKIAIEFRAEKGRFLISVSDDGVGIPAADLPLVFKRFYRVQKHHARHAIKGTGLGLSIVKRAVEAHRGEVTVESAPGRTTTFTISVPGSSLAAAKQPRFSAE